MLLSKMPAILAQPRRGKCFREIAHASDRQATLHGVVFDILGTRAVVAMRLACRPELAGLCLTEGRKSEANSRAPRAAECRGMCAREDDAAPSTVTVGPTGRSSIPAALVIERISHGVLDAPCAEHDGGGRGASYSLRHSRMVRRTRPQMRSCASGNLEILRCAIAHHSSMRSLSSGRASRGPGGIAPE
jgi:hypothetical protein